MVFLLCKYSNGMLKFKENSFSLKIQKYQGRVGERKDLHYLRKKYEKR